MGPKLFMHVDGRPRTVPTVFKRHALPDVRDVPHVYDNAAASSTDANPRWRDWDDDYTMGY